MQCGLFGKLPAKRDFVAYNMARPFLDGWERWLQAAMAESQHALGERWKDIFLTLPIWRFWCGPLVFGQAVTGAVMASVDGVGRYFPLSICALGSADEYPVVPPDAALSDWLGTCEQALLGMLDDTSPFDPTQVLAHLGHPPAFHGPFPTDTGQTIQFRDGSDGSLQAAFAGLTNANQLQTNHNRSLWWTLGGQSFPERLITIDGPLPPALWITLMTGQIAT